jgi:hypothetical protein
VGLFDKQVKRKGGGLFSSRRNEDRPFDVNRVNQSIENARLRIQDAGYDPGDADRRNFFEKATNLPQGQNAFFDALELLSRPGQAVLNAIDKSNEGGKVGESLWRGFSGQDRVRGSELVEEMGVDNKVLKALLGTGLEVVSDPLTYVPGGVLLKGAKGAAKVATAPIKGAYNLIENTSPALRQFREETIQPTLQRGKDALGRAFVPDYKLDEDLYGRTDDTLLKAKQETENRIRFQTEESMRKVADQANAAGGIDKGADVGRIMESGLKQFDEAGNEIPRIERELSSDPAIRQAAENLMQSNTELREWARSNGIPVGELEGYMKHVLAAEERKRRKNLKAMPIDRGNFGTGQPDKKVVASRELMGSVEDVNEQMIQGGRLKEGETFFEPNAFFATAIGQKQLIEYANAAKFRREVLSNPNFAQKYEKGTPVPNNAVVIDTNNYKFLSDDASNELGLANEVGGEYVTTKAVKQALDRYKKLTGDEGINSFIKAFDTAQSWWKRTTLFSAPYHLRNAMGAMFNNYVGGMNPVSLAKYTKEGYQDVYNAVIKGDESPLFREFREQGLGSSSLSGVEFARRGEDAEKAIERTIKKRSQFDGTLGGRVKTELKELKNPLNAFETSRDLGDFIDQTNRFAMYKWAKDKGLTPEQAAKKVREVQFDYSRTTPLEREVATRFIPFYRWMRNNLPYQIRSFINDPRKYANVNKLRLNATESAGFDEEDVPEWMREQFAIPILGDGGTGKALGLNLPVGDLTKVSDPLTMLLNSLTPLAKLPAELAMNRSTFYDRPIQEFAGQERQLSIPENFLGIPVPGGGKEFGSALQPNETLAYLLEQLGGQPVRETLKLLASPKDEDQAKKFKDPVLGISSVLKDIDANKSKFFQQREELQKLMDLIDYIEQQTGSRPRGVNEIR